ncbi:sulfite exporter TauE/SafE family protein [Shimia sp. R9_1]|uniref:TSUP family transporter n=1 Tax=Shimia sp. R9_1 TaxID=2821111 RepID=UPI001ADC4380|nr:TSUP family transporter [Shimia sp. R9_1]MBO9405841.1 sulfite exporter TauE/SafE family protein [Shimia sp. R9_1]
MHDILTQALALDGFAWVAAAAFVAGIVRGFAGFGTALIYLPIAAQVMPPLWAIITLAGMDILAPAVHIPAALRNGHRRDLLRLMIGVVLLMPAGLWLLERTEPDVYRYLVSLLSLGMLVVLLTGFRYRGAVTAPMVYGIGGAGGLLGGAAGLPGPPVIMFYMASPHGPTVIRANTNAYLFFYDILLVVVLICLSRFEAAPFVLGIMLSLPAMAGNLLGGWLFDPRHEKLYRAVAYLIIAAAALSGLPFLNAGGGH